MGETSLRQVYENDEQKQEDTAHFIELVAASALFDFLHRTKPEKQQFMTRAIEDDKDSMSLLSLGKGYESLVKTVADYMLLRCLVINLPKEKFFPLSKNRGFNASFYNDSGFKELARFTEVFYKWYNELATNNRAFAPIHANYDNTKYMSGWIKDIELDAKDDSYYLLEMIKASNECRSKDHDNKFRFFLQFAYNAINHYTNKIYK